MKIAIITSIRTPYRTKQIEEICRQNRIDDIVVYYTSSGDEGREWETNSSELFKEFYLEGIKLSNRYGHFNKGLKKIVEENDFIFIGGYEKPTYIILSILCRILRKEYAIIFDGISRSKLLVNKSGWKYALKKFVISNSSYLWANGDISYKYFTEGFDYPPKRIYNQYLTIDGRKIIEFNKSREYFREFLRKKYGIGSKERVIQCSGRLIKLKNIDFIIKSLSRIKDEKITLFITGDGKEKENLIKLAQENNIKLIITGFINNQEDLFKHYYVSDIFVLASVNEAWGLVVNEAMYSKLPVLVSEECGCSLDLVKNNGLVFNPRDLEDFNKKLMQIFNQSSIEKMGEESFKIISEWNFNNSAKNFNQIINNIRKTSC